MAITANVFAGGNLEGTSTESYSDYFIQARNIPHVQIYKEKPDLCSCVSYLKARLGISQKTSLGNARDIKPTSTEPSVGGVILTSEGSWGHAGYIVRFDKETVTFDESNYIPCQETRRTLKRSDPVIRGYR